MGNLPPTSFGAKAENQRYQNKTKKIIKTIFAIPIAAPAMPVKPNTPAPQRDNQKKQCPA
jgi:hypothetical protein